MLFANSRAHYLISATNELLVNEIKVGEVNHIIPHRLILTEVFILYLEKHFSLQVTYCLTQLFTIFLHFKMFILRFIQYCICMLSFLCIHLN